MSFNKVKMLIAYSIIYVSFCIAIINFIGIDFDFRHRLFQNLYGLHGFCYWLPFYSMMEQRNLNGINCVINYIFLKIKHQMEDC